MGVTLQRILQRATFLIHFWQKWDIFGVTSLFTKNALQSVLQGISAERTDSAGQGPALSRGPGQPSSACVQPRSDPRTIHALSYGNHVDLHPAGSDRRPHLAGPVVPGRKGRDRPDQCAADLLIPLSLTEGDGQLDIISEMITLPYLCFCSERL